MFDAIRNNKRIVQVFLFLITVPFAVWGLEAYFNGGGGDLELATVGKAKIMSNQFREELRKQQDRIRQQIPNADTNILNSLEVRESVLENMINRSLVFQEAKRQNLDVLAAMQSLIAQEPAFQEKGVFSKKRYEEALAAQGTQPVEFEANFQEQLVEAFLLSSAGQAAFMPKTVMRRIIALQVESREVQENLLTWQSFAGQIKVTDADVKQFYDANAPRFTLPELIQVEFVALERDKLEGRKKFPDDELKAWYEGHRDQFAIKPEERRASHILLLTENADKAKVKADAEALLAEVRKEPGRFAELAKTRSQDPGSAAQGGDLGFFRHQDMVKPFADATFALKVGEVSAVVESSFGFHIIRLDEIRPGQYKPFAEVRKEVEAELQRQNAAQQFAKAADDFYNTVFEQSDSLQPAAQKFNLQVQKSDWISRENGGPLGHPGLMEAMFSDEMLKNGRNTKAVEVVPGVLVSARLLEHKPATRVPFEEVKQGIVTELTRQKAQALAVEKGTANLKALLSGDETKISWSKAQTIARLHPGTLTTRESLDAIFRADARKLPGYVGVELPGVGYALYKVNKVTADEISNELASVLSELLSKQVTGRDKDIPVTAGKLSDELVQALSEQFKLADINANAQMSAYRAALRQRYKVEINRKLLEDSKD
ncbi:MAG: SurA N-terminal domain-containing protein [Zoogloeaceae bacterium]|jgi:peptidyl-prolyl cis-trans isomerase D|nr:SurA N-terminal domain-containing protein [Zoogloeaceae bacterium]